MRRRMTKEEVKRSKDIFLKTLYKHRGSAYDACKELKVPTSTHYRWMKSDPDYAANFNRIKKKYEPSPVSGNDKHEIDYAKLRFFPCAFSAAIERYLALPNPHQRLGIAVLRNTIRDARMIKYCTKSKEFRYVNKYGKYNLNQTGRARSFLTEENSGLRYWCDVIGLDVDYVVSLAKNDLMHYDKWVKCRAERIKRKVV